MSSVVNTPFGPETIAAQPAPGSGSGVNENNPIAAGERAAGANAAGQTPGAAAAGPVTVSVFVPLGTVYIPPPNVSAYNAFVESLNAQALATFKADLAAGITNAKLVQLNFIVSVTQPNPGTCIAMGGRWLAVMSDGSTWDFMGNDILG